ncbi:MAG: glycosyltransferase [Thermogutta sp.]
MANDLDTDPARLRSRRLRVVLFSTQIGWGGGEEQARLTVRGLSAANCDVLTVAPAGSALRDRLRGLGFSVFDVPCRGRGLCSWLAMRRVIRWFQPHILFFNDPHAIIHGGLASIGLKIVRIGARRTVFPLRSGWLYRRLLDGIVCSSQAAAAACLHAGIPSARIHIIHEGVDLERIRSANPGRGRVALHELVKKNNSSPSCPRLKNGDGYRERDNTIRFIVNVGKLTPAKGQDDLLTAFAGLAQKCPETVLVMIGEGELRPHLEARISALGLEKRVILPGFRNDVLDLVAAADLFVFPSREEGLGGSLMEAILLGVPAVASSAGGIPEVLAGDPPLGTVVPPANPDALRAALEETLSLSYEQRLSESVRAKKIAEEKFSEERMVRQLRQLFYEKAFPGLKSEIEKFSRNASPL